nr:pentatricopeptide repeat-containing protein At1g62350-like [Ipomoea trifida]
MVAKELKWLQSDPIRLERHTKSNVSRLLKSYLLAVLAEFQRQYLIFLSMKNKRVDEAKKVWEYLKSEGVLFYQHTFGDLVMAFLDSGLCDEAMHIYDEMRSSTDPPLSLPYRVILKGLFPYPHLRENVKDDFLEHFIDMIIYDLPEDLFDDDEWRKENEDN